MHENLSNETRTLQGIRDAVERHTKRKTILGFGMVILLLGAGAFMAGRLFGDGTPIPTSEDVTKVDPEGGSVSTGAVRLEPDDRLPDRMPTAVGQFHHREDNRIFINQYPPLGQMVILAEIDEYPILEIVLTKDALLYKDVTDLSQAYEKGVAQQIVAPGSVEDLDGNCSIVVWGELRGDRIRGRGTPIFAELNFRDLMKSNGLRAGDDWAIRSLGRRRG